MYPRGRLGVEYRAGRVDPLARVVNLDIEAVVDAVVAGGDFRHPGP
jgi:hypothetical protein